MATCYRISSQHSDNQMPEFGSVQAAISDFVNNPPDNRIDAAEWDRICYDDEGINASTIAEANAYLDRVIERYAREVDEEAVGLSTLLGTDEYRMAEAVR